MLAIVATILVLQAPDTSTIAKDLTNSNRHTRLAALDKMPKPPNAPASLLAPLIQFAKIDAASAFDAKPLKRIDGKSLLTSAIEAGDTDVSFVRIKANPRDYVGKTFTVIASLSLSDYYNHAYKNSATDYYSFKIREIGKSGEMAQAYAMRIYGRGLVDRVVALNEKGFASVPLRLRCTIGNDRFRLGDEVHVLELLQVLDWQYRTDDGNGWEPWAIEPIARAMGYAGAISPGGAAALADLLADENELGSPQTDLCLRVCASAAIGNLSFSEADKAEAYKIVTARSGKHNQLANSEYIGQLCKQAMATFEPPIAYVTEYINTPLPQTKTISPETKAASLLKLGDNLAKAGKAKAAQGYYKQVIKDFPATKAAATAKARLSQ